MSVKILDSRNISKTKILWIGQKFSNKSEALSLTGKKYITLNWSKNSGRLC